MRTPFDLVIRRFARFLDVAWGAVFEVARTIEHVEWGELMADWLQANWELLVETPFRDLSGFGNTYFAIQTQDGWDAQGPPFDCVLGYQDDKEAVIELEQVSFSVSEIGRG